MAVESPNKTSISPLKFFNRSVKVDQQNVAIATDRLVQIDGSLKKILNIRSKSIDISRLEEEQVQREEKEKKLEAGKFFVRGVGKLANRIPGKNTIQKFLLFMAFGWLFNTFSKYFSELSGPLSKIIIGGSRIIDAFSKIAFSIFDGFVTFIDIGYKTWDVIRGTEDSQKLQSAMDNVLLDLDSFFGGVLSLLGIVEQPPPEPEGPAPGEPPQGAPGAPGAPTVSGTLPKLPQGPQLPPQVTGGIIPSRGVITSTYGSQESFRSKPHTGIDYGYPEGTAISLVKSGEVVEASTAYNGGYGNFILVKHNDGTYSMFNHLRDIYVKKGQKISASTGNAPVIGTIGNTGFSTGPHLDFKVATKWDGWSPSGFVDPRPYQDNVFRIGGDVKVKPSEQIKRLAKEKGKEGFVTTDDKGNRKFTPKPWTKEEKERYARVSGEQQESAKASPVRGSVSRALLDTISFAEGTRKSYGTVFGGKVIPELERGEMTISQVLEMQRTGSFNGIQYIPKNKYGSDATGRYQFMSYVLKEEVQKQGIPMNSKFTPSLQDKIILGRIARFRGVTPELLQKEGMSTRVMDMLAPEFASFPYSPKGNKSYYGQPVKSPQSIQNAYNKSLGKKGGGIIGDIPKQTNNINPSSVSSYPSYSEGGTMMIIQPVIIEKPVSVSSNRGKTSFPQIGGVNSSSMNNFRG